MEKHFKKMIPKSITMNIQVFIYYYETVFHYNSVIFLLFYNFLIEKKISNINSNSLIDKRNATEI